MNIIKCDRLKELLKQVHRILVHVASYSLIYSRDGSASELIQSYECIVAPVPAPLSPSLQLGRRRESRQLPPLRQRSQWLYSAIRRNYHSTDN